MIPGSHTIRVANPEEPAEAGADLILVAVPNRRRTHIDFLQAVRSRCPAQPLGVVSSDHFPDAARAAREVEALLYITTGCPADAVQAGLRCALAGTRFYIDESAAPPAAPAGAPADLELRLSKLTGREREVMALLGRGNTNRDIAEALDLREGTVRIYVHRVIRQLGLRNRVDVALCASRLVASAD